MLLTEKEARTKICPNLAPTQTGGAEAWTPEHARCFASDCMAWRWFDCVTKDGDRAVYVESARTPAPPHLEGRLATRRGFCGLAGSPG